jgi:hypothetical protein
MPNNAVYINHVTLFNTDFNRIITKFFITKNNIVVEGIFGKGDKIPHPFPQTDITNLPPILNFNINY